jgi:hypothetical protein
MCNADYSLIWSIVMVGEVNSDVRSNTPVSEGDLIS